MSDIDQLKEKIRIAKLKINEAIYAADRDIVSKRRSELAKLESELEAQEPAEIAGDDAEVDSQSILSPLLTKIPDTEEPKSLDEITDSAERDNSDPEAA